MLKKEKKKLKEEYLLIFLQRQASIFSTSLNMDRDRFMFMRVVTISESRVTLIPPVTSPPYDKTDEDVEVRVFETTVELYNLCQKGAVGVF